MIWQDLIFTIGGFGFSLALLPSILGKGKPDRKSCLITGGILLAYIVAFVGQGYIASAISTGLTCLCWATLYFQQRKDS